MQVCFSRMQVCFLEKQVCYLQKQVCFIKKRVCNLEKQTRFSRNRVLGSPPMIHRIHRNSLGICHLPRSQCHPPLGAPVSPIGIFARHASSSIRLMPRNAMPPPLRDSHVVPAVPPDGRVPIGDIGAPSVRPARNAFCAWNTATPASAPQIRNTQGQPTRNASSFTPNVFASASNSMSVMHRVRNSIRAINVRSTSQPASWSRRARSSCDQPRSSRTRRIPGPRIFRNWRSFGGLRCAIFGA